MSTVYSKYTLDCKPCVSPSPPSSGDEDEIQTTNGEYMFLNLIRETPSSLVSRRADQPREGFMSVFFTVDDDFTNELYVAGDLRLVSPVRSFWVSVETHGVHLAPC